MVAVKEKAVKKKKVNSNRRAKMSEVDKVFKETIEYWEGLAKDAYSETNDVVATLNLVEKEYSGDSNSYELIQFIRVVKRSIEVVQSKTEKLEDSLDSAGMIKPIDELEGKVIGALRVLGKEMHTSISTDCKSEVYKSLLPLFKLAGKVGFSFPNWLRDYVDIPEQKDDSSMSYYGTEARFLRWYDWTENAKKILDKVISLEKMSSHKSIKKQLDQARRNCEEISISICHYHGDDMGKIAQEIKRSTDYREECNNA